MADLELEAPVEPEVVEEKKRSRVEEEGAAEEGSEKKICTEEQAVPMEAEKTAEKTEETLEAGMEEEKQVAEGPAVEEDVELQVASEAHEAPTEAKLGPKIFTSAMDMFNFFYDLLHAWPVHFNVNKYEHLMLEDLITKGHQDPEKKIGAGIEGFQVRIHPDFYSRCYYIIRTDGSADDFSYRKCVDNILPLPEEFKARSGDLRVGKKHKGPGGYKGHFDNRGRRGGRFGGRGYGRGNRGRGGGHSS